MQSFTFANESAVMIFMKLHKNSRVIPQPQKFSAENFELYIDCYIPGLPIQMYLYIQWHYISESLL